MQITADLKKKLYREMLRIRRVQLRIESLYHLDEMKTPVHLYIGQEAVAVGVCANLTEGDYISSNHRSHGHYLAKGGDLPRMIAELYCRETGCSRGRGGSMHLVDPAVGHLGSSSIVGGGIPVGTGMGLALRMQKKPWVSVVFFGDGAADEGVLYESINFAVLKRLPVIFIYENNQFSVCSRVSARQAGAILFHAAPPDQMDTNRVDGNSVLDVYAAAHRAVHRARHGQGPSFIECETYRMRGHAGAGSDVRLGYRTADEIASWEARCPVSSFQNILFREGILGPEERERMEQEIGKEIDAAFSFARESPFPEPEHVESHLYRDE